uniref:DUF1758 domain-containing protein n=1 Tax=Strongyloides venezuelensis TaxID=75913 RepID=A0A0K0FCD8_STRVS
METLCGMVNVNFDEMEKLPSHNKVVMLRLLNLHIDTDLRNELLDFSSPDELIEEVTAKYSSTSLVSRIKLQKSLYQLSKEPQESMGHTYKQCPSKREYKKPLVTSNMYKSHGNQVNYVNNNENPIQEEALMTCLPIDDLSSDNEVEWALSAKKINFKENNVDTAWFLDSGATVYLCRNSELLSNLMPLKPGSIMVANKSVYYHPVLAANLISIVKLKEIAKMFIENEDICFRQNNFVLVYFDLAGKISPRGLDGKEYHCIALDKYSKATQIIPLKSKANTLQVVKQIISLWESLVGTPQQISVERYNRYVKENVSTIIINRRLPKNTWSLICTSVPYVKNRIRSSATMMEPIKLLGLKFTIDHLRCIGCMVIYKKDKDIKMGMKGNIGVFLAYGPKNSYKILDVATNCIKVTSNVEFYVKCDYIDAKMFYKRLVLHETKIPAHINDIDDLNNILFSYSPKYITGGNVCENNSSTNNSINEISYELKKDILDLPHKFKEFSVSNDNGISKTQSDYIRNPKFVNESPVATKTRKKGSAFFVTSASGYLEVSQLPDWKESMKKELENLIKNNTWTYVKKNDIGKQNVITSKLVYNV